MRKPRKFEYANLYEYYADKGWFCADKSKYTAEQTRELFKREYRAEMDDLEFHGGSAEEYRDKVPVHSGYARYAIGRNEDGEPCGGYVFSMTLPENWRGQTIRHGYFEVWAICDGTEYDG